jgi:hypothetical protein
LTHTSGPAPYLAPWLRSVVAAVADRHA